MLFFFTILFSLSSFSVTTKIACFDRVTESITAVGTIKEWYDFPDGKAGEFFEGGYIELYLQDESSVLVTHTKQNVLALKFSEPSCQTVLVSKRNEHTGFNDLDLGKLMTKNKKGIIYLWSPQMILSEREKDHFPKLDYPITVLEAPGKGEAGSRKKLSPYTSLYLVNPVHFPQTFFYRDGKFVKMIPGVHNDTLQSLASEILK